MPKRNVKRNDVGAHWPYWSKRAHDDAKRHADQAVSGALKRGALVRRPCEICADPESEAHHDDYSKPLVVRWLCRSHHRSFHLGRPVVAAKHDRWKRRSPDAAMPLILALTQAIQDEMERQDMTQHEFAARCGVSQPTISNLFSSGYKSVASLFFAADALGAKLDIRFVPRGRQSSRVA